MLLVAAVSLGGGQGALGDAVVQLLALLLLAILAGNARCSRVVATPRWTWAPVAAVVCLPLLQCLPLSPGLWASLGERGEIAAELAHAAVVPNPRWGLNPTASERAFMWLLPAIALYLAVMGMSRRHRMGMVLLLLTLVIAQVLVGLAQLAGGSGSPLRFYASTNPTDAVGFFANRNHFAGLVALALPLALALTAGAVVERYEDRSRSLLRIAAGAGTCLLLILGLALSRSRAGILLGMVAMLLSAPILLGLQRRRGMRRVLFATMVLSGLLVVQFALFGLLQRFGQDPLEDGRWVYAGTSARAAAAYGPLGSGLGTFRQAYQPFERDSAEGPRSTIVNHAHNDYLELWLETGWLMLPAAGVLLGVLAFAAARAIRVRKGRADLEAVLARTMVVAIAIPVVHSMVDYPLRTTAHLAVFGLLCGMLVAGALQADARGTRAAGRDAPTS